MPAPKELVDDLCAAIDRHNVMVSRSSVYCRLLSDGDGGRYMVWEVSLIGTDGFEFTLSERAMPTKDDPQN